MSIVRLNGGLGNQLFQLAFAIALSSELNIDVGLDIEHYLYSDPSTNRSFAFEGLQSERIHVTNSASRTRKFVSNLRIRHLSAHILRTRNMELESLSKIYNLSVIREGKTIFDPEISIKDNSYYIGNFVSPQYWMGHKSRILNEVGKFIGHDALDGVGFENERLSIHIRRGDYVSNQKARNFHGICGLDYYTSAVNQMLTTYSKIDSIEIFSDEPSVADSLISKLDFLGRRVSYSRLEKPIQTLQVMSISKYFIGCNSTFSWWAAALNANRFSILPSQWFLDDSYRIDAEKYFIGNVHLSKVGLE